MLYEDSGIDWNIGGTFRTVLPGMLALWHMHCPQPALCRVPRRRRHPPDQPTFGITVIQDLTESHRDALGMMEADLVLSPFSQALLFHTASPGLS